MPGTLIPPWYSSNVPTSDELATASVVWGLSLGLSLFALIRAGQQTLTQWRRAHRFTAYIVFVWLELISSTIMSGIAWGYVRQGIPPSLWYFCGVVLVWVFQVHCILQIIITRIALLELNKTTVFSIRWGVFIAVLVVNISVACVWIPARLQRSQEYIRINDIWDRIEKAIIAVIDVGLNAYFIYLVRSSLIAYGLSKYIRLYRFNLAMIFISMTMDVLIIGMMSLSNTFLYVCFHPLAYLVKLHIEMTMAELIAKIVKASGRGSCCSCACDVTSPYGGDHEIPFPYFQGFEHPRYQDDDQGISPTMGCFRRKWPLDRFRHRIHEADRAAQFSQRPIQRPKKLARIETYRLGKLSWFPSPVGGSGSGTEDLELGTRTVTTATSNMSQAMRRSSSTISPRNTGGHVQ